MADVVPDELRQIAEFLNEQMNPAEVYAVEVKTYCGGPRGHGDCSDGVRPDCRRKCQDFAALNYPDPATLLERSQPSTLEMLDRFDELAAATGLVVHQTPAGALLKTRRRASIANVYLADWDSLDVPLQPLRDRDWVAEAVGPDATPGDDRGAPDREGHDPADSDAETY